MAEGEEETLQIVRVEGDVDLWLTWETYSDPFNRGNLYYWSFKLGQTGQHIHTQSEKETCLLKLVRELYDQKIGYLASRWNDAYGSGLKDGLPIEYEHAKIRLGDVFDYYTTSDGVLKVPKWVNFKYAVEEYLENDPEYHLS